MIRLKKNKTKHMVLLILASVLANIVIPVVIIGIPLIILISEANENDTIDNVPEFLNDKIELDVKDCKVKENIDTHFISDGDVYITLDCSKKSEYITKQISNWNKLPLSENLKIELYGGNVDDQTYRFGILEDNEDYYMPVIPNGYYYFVDKQNKEAEKHSDKYLLDDDRYSFNYYIAIYDIDTNKLYYIEDDT